MANWAITDYVIEGSKESLKRIYDAIKNHEVEEESDNDWEGNILNALGIDWDRELYMRGFMLDTEKTPSQRTVYERRYFMLHYYQRSPPKHCHY